MIGNRSTRNGVTLIEISISLILVTTVLLVSLTASANLLRNGTVSRGAIDAERLGSRLLDEITSMDFRDRDSPVFGLESGEVATDRQTFDDLDDYDGYVSDPPTNRDGTNIAGFEDWSISVTVQPAEPDTAGVLTSGDDGKPMRWITVTCTAPNGTTTEVATSVSDVPSDLDPSTSYERWRQLDLDFTDRDLTITIPLRNAPDAY